MFRFLISRIGVLLPTFIGVTLVAFALIRLVPGDPVELMVGERGISKERHAELLSNLGLDRPLHEQYFSYVAGIFEGDLGKSFVTKTTVVQEFFERFPATVELSLIAMLIALMVGIPVGILAAVKRGSFFDHTVMGISLTGYSMPIFWWAPMLILLVSLNMGLTPISGRMGLEFWVEPVTGFMLIDTILEDNWPAFWSALHHMILPAIVLGTIPMAVFARMTRSSMLEVLGEDYICTAYAKGLSKFRVINVHALRNALIPVVTVIGLQTGTLLAGAILTETIFSWPGIGKWMVESISRRDYPIVQGGILLIASTVILVNLTVDLIYGLINPKIRHQRH